jgi:hypothetical protein
MKPALTNQTEKDLKLFFEDRAKRTLRYIDHAQTISEHCEQYRDEIHVLQNQGSLLLQGVCARRTLLDIGQRFSAFIDRGDCLTPAKDRARKMIGPLSADLPLRDRASSIGLEDPLVNLPEVVDLAFDARLLGLATAYFQTVPFLSYVKIRKSFVNALPPSPTQQFHVDIGTYSIFKVLLYLNDVAPGGGPFCFVQGSHRKKFTNWESKRYSSEEMAAVYGEGRVVQYYARAGDAILVESTGFHRGEKPETADRSILILNYTVHPEYGFEYPPVRMRREDRERLPEYAGLVADGVLLTP